MSDSDVNGSPVDEQALAADDVLARLPRTRPQRPSARRRPSGRAQKSPQAEPAAIAAPAPKRRAPATPKAPRTAAPPPPSEPPAPVVPPSNGELLAGAVGAIGDIAAAGLAVGGRVLKGTLGRLKP
jgi:hypothetical protein